jgi:hypothetical protein
MAMFVGKWAACRSNRSPIDVSTSALGNGLKSAGGGNKRAAAAGVHRFFQS